MTARLAHLPANGPICDIRETLETDGAVIVDDFLAEDLLARFNDELDALMQHVDPDRAFVNPAIAYFFGKRTRHLAAVAAHSRIFAHEILPHPVYDAVCSEVLGKSASSHILNIAHVMDRGPGAEQQLLHRDHDIWPHLPHPHPEVQLASVIALEDFDAENGATRVVPGSHRWPRDRKPTESEIAVAEMKTGSAVIYLGSAIHAGGANTTACFPRRLASLAKMHGTRRRRSASSNARARRAGTATNSPPRVILMAPPSIDFPPAFAPRRRPASDFPVDILRSDGFHCGTISSFHKTNLRCASKR